MPLVLTKRISYDDYLKAKGLHHLAKEAAIKSDGFEQALCRLLGYEDDYAGHITDSALDAGDSRTFEEALKLENFEVINDD